MLIIPITLICRKITTKLWMVGRQSWREVPLVSRGGAFSLPKRNELESYAKCLGCACLFDSVHEECFMFYLVELYFISMFEFWIQFVLRLDTVTILKHACLRIFLNLLQCLMIFSSCFYISKHVFGSSLSFSSYLILQSLQIPRPWQFWHCQLTTKEKIWHLVTPLSFVNITIVILINFWMNDPIS